MTFRLVAAGAVAISLSLAACGSDSKSASTTAAPTTTAMSGTTVPMAGGTIVDVAAGNADFSTLVAAVKAADLAGTLSGTGPFTVFAPTWCRAR